MGILPFDVSGGMMDVMKVFFMGANLLNTHSGRRRADIANPVSVIHRCATDLTQTFILQIQEGPSLRSG